MAAPPRLPNLDPRDMMWVRWITDQVQTLNTSSQILHSNVQANGQQASAAQATAHNVVRANTAAEQALHPTLPTAPPQQPTTPLLTSDHGTVTISWDGFVHATLTYTPAPGDDMGSAIDPQAGFRWVRIERGTSATGPWTPVGGTMGITGTVVDTDVTVGTQYWYHFITVDYAGIESAPGPASSIVVKGVDLGTLDADVTSAIDAAAAAGQAGQDAAAAAQTAADTADAKAAQALQDAASAQQAANDAMTAAENATGTTQVVIGTTAPTDTTGQVLWIDTTNGANTPKRYNGTTWVTLTDKAATDAAAAAVAAQNTANSKNKVVYSTSNASGTTGYITGDLWYKVDVNNVVLGQWQFNGTAWVSQAVSGTMIAANTIAASRMIAGTITAASGILADAVITNAKIADLAVNNAKINDLDGNKIQAATIVAGKLAAGSVTTNNIVAGAIDTNRLAAGAITADKISLGGLSNASPLDRVPQPLTNNAFWSVALASTTVFPGYGQGAATGSTSNSGYGPGITVNNGGFFFLNTPTPTPPSRRLVISGVVDGAAQFVLREFAGPAVVNTVVTDTPIQVVSTGVPVTLRADTQNYYVYTQSGDGRGYSRFTDAHIFEVIGNSNSAQSAQLSPSGLQLFDSYGSLALDLTTNAAQYIQINDTSGAEPQTVAAIDQSGNAAFNFVSSDMGYDIAGILLTDPDPTTGVESLINAAPNGSSWNGSVPLLDRLSRGVIYDVNWDRQDGINITTQFRRIAQDQFTLEDGRAYEIHVQTGGLQIQNNGNTVNIYLEFQLNTHANVSVTDGQTVMRAVEYGQATNYANKGGYMAFPPVIWTASAAVTTIDYENRLLPANVPIYWQLNTNMSSAPAGGTPSINEFGYARGVTVIDVGSAYLTRPNGNDAMSKTTDNTTSGSSTGTTSTGTTATSKTVTFTAKDSRTWNNGGSTVVTGSGQYTNGDAMYYGHGASAMGSWFGQFRDGSNRSLNSVVGGKTVTSAVLTVQNSYTYYSGGATVSFGTSSSDTQLSTIGTPTNNVFSSKFAKGGKNSITLSSAIRSGLSGGSVQSFVLGVSDSQSNYSYFRGARQSAPPTLKVTYH